MLTGRRQRTDQFGAAPHQVLAVVEHDQEVSFVQVLRERVGQRLAGLLVDVHRAPQGRCDQRGFADSLQVHPVGSVGKDRRHLPGDLHRQPGLSAATRTGQGHHPGVGNEVGHLRPFTFAADKCRDANRKPAPHRH